MDLARSFCQLHPARAAAALCPRCRRFFCRECVTEHADLLLCKSCIERAGETAARRRRLIEWPMRIGSLAAGLLIVYVIFYFAGQILAWIPPYYHSGKSW